MSYEYKESMKEDLQHLYEIPTGVWKYKEKLEELDEVYAKADAFDRYIENQQKKLRTIEHKIKFNNKIEAKDFTEYIDTRDKIDELERYFQ